MRQAKEGNLDCETETQGGQKMHNLPIQAASEALSIEDFEEHGRAGSREQNERGTAATEKSKRKKEPPTPENGKERKGKNQRTVSERTQALRQLESS